MKKIYFVLVISLLLGFVGLNKASGQPGCQYCLAPWVCSTFSLNITCNNVDYTINYTICYYCYLTRPDVDVVFTEIAGIPVGSDCYWQAKQAGEQWVLDHGLDLCGNLPCQEGSKRFKIYFPICADMINTVTSFTMRLNPDCNLKCYNEYEWCWCNCVPGECWDERCPNPHVRYRLIAGPLPEGNSTCEYKKWAPNITIPCQRFDTPCNDDGYPQ